MLKRRELFVGLMVTPAIIRSGSLMRVSPRHWSTWQRDIDEQVIEEYLQAALDSVRAMREEFGEERLAMLCRDYEEKKDTMTKHFKIQIP